MFSQKHPLSLFHYRGQLPEVSYEQQLHSPERECGIAHTPQHIIHIIQQIGPHHAHLVDHKHIHRAYQRQFLL